MNPWKKTILLAKFKKYWEPIMMVKSKGETERLFDYNNLVIKKILTTENLISYFEGNKINKQYILNEDIYDIIQQEKTKLKIKEIEPQKELIEEDSDTVSSESTDSSVRTDSDNDLFIKEDELEELKKLNKTICYQKEISIEIYLIFFFQTIIKLS
jgi:hypothetical protein